MRSAVLSIALLSSAPALAGGVGIVGTGGTYNQPVYFYDGANDNLQYRQQQMIPTFGTGIEFVLGDKDDRWQGLFRGYWLGHAPEADPATRTTSVDADDVISNHRDYLRHTGLAMVGVQWGFWGRPEGFMLTANAMIGSGFLTFDHEEWLQAELGAGAAYRLSRRLQLAGNVAYAIKQRKGITHGVNGYVSLRFLFD